MSYSAHGIVHEADLPPRLKVACHAMAGFLNETTGQLNPSMSTIARYCGVGECQARRLIHELISLGYLSVVANHEGGHQNNSRRYVLHLDRLPMLKAPSVDATPIRDDTPSASDSHPSHGCEGPLAPMIATPSASATQTKKEPRNKPGRNQEGRASAAHLPCPADVDQQIWADWLTLRKTKKAPVTETVLKGARTEADKAGLSLTAFLEIWCTRGSQGLQADWIKPHELKQPGWESFAEADERRSQERAAEWMGRAPAKTFEMPTARRRSAPELAPSWIENAT